MRINKSINRIAFNFIPLRWAFKRMDERILAKNEKNQSKTMGI